MKLTTFFTSLLLGLTFSVCVSAGDFSVDFTQKGEAVKPVNGTNFWAKLNGNRICDMHQAVADAHFSTVRLHDIPLQNPGMRIVDTPQIFGRFDADTNDPKNYYWDATDDYLQRIIDGGSQIVYRLGASIEHTQPHRYFAKEPADHLQFAKICEGIIRHYNEGWGDGFNYNIEYWEIWNEPNLNPQMWDKDFTAYCKMYVTVAKYLKEKFPNIKIGGPVLTHAEPGLCKQFIDTCKAGNAPIDFFSWHAYPNNPKAVLDPPFMLRKMLDEAGYTKTELHLNEWHYFPCTWAEIHGTEGGPERKSYWRNSPEGLSGYDASGFYGYVLTRWQDTPLTMGNFYGTTSGTWGLISDDYQLRKPYYVFKMFGEMMQMKPVRVKSTDRGNVSVMGVVGENGQKAIFASNWKQNVENLEIQLTGVPESGTVKVIRNDNQNDWAESTVEYKDSVLKIRNQPGSWVLYIVF